MRYLMVAGMLLMAACVPRAYDAAGAVGYGLTALAGPAPAPNYFRPMPVVPTWTNYRTGQMWFGSLP